jgi:hypothetical protein
MQGLLADEKSYSCRSCDQRLNDLHDGFADVLCCCALDVRMPYCTRLKVTEYSTSTKESLGANLILDRDLKL